MARPLVIAVDFDGTICEHKYPEIGEPIQPVIDWLKEHQRKGNKLILWTCRNNKELFEAIIWCEEKGVFFDAVNDDVESVRDSDFGKVKSHKVCADIYLDDRNLSLGDI